MSTHARILPDARPVPGPNGNSPPRRGYWIAEIEVLDPVRYHQYVEAMIEVLDTLGAELLLRTPKAPQPDNQMRTVVIGFDSFVAAQIGWNDPALRKARDMFADVCRYDVQIVEGEDLGRPYVAA